MRICYFGAFDPQYARNNFLRQSLTLAGCQIVSCNVPTVWPTYRKYPALLQKYRRLCRECDLIIVAEFGQTIVPLAWLLGRLRSQTVVFDHVIGLYESSVIEKRRYAPNSFAARKLYLLDSYAGKLPAGILTGTDAYKNYLGAEFAISLDRIYVAPLGVNDEIFFPQAKPEHNSGAINILFLGSYLPNHGVDIILEAAALLRGEGNLHFRLVGDGLGKQAAHELSRELKLTNIEFNPMVKFLDVPQQIAAADIVLGNFGDTPQSRKAMANKVLQGLAMQRAVISGDTPAIRENFNHGEHLWLCQLGDPKALAGGLLKLAQDAQLRKKLANTGYLRVTERLTPQAVGPVLKNYLSSLL